MMVLGEKFYNLYDASEEVYFTIEQVEQVLLQPVQVAVVDIENDKFVREDEFYLVLVTLRGDEIASSAPLLARKHAEDICENLSERCRRFHGMS